MSGLRSAQQIVRVIAGYVQRNVNQIIALRLISLSLSETVFVFCLFICLFIIFFFFFFFFFFFSCYMLYRLLEVLLFCISLASGARYCNNFSLFIACTFSFVIFVVWVCMCCDTLLICGNKESIYLPRDRCLLCLIDVYPSKRQSVGAH